MKKQKNKKIDFFKNNYEYFITIIILTLLFFLFKPYFSPDACGYYYLSTIINKVSPVGTWWAVRGFSFPLYLATFTKILGQNIFGISFALYFAYITNHIIQLLIINKLIINYNLQKYKKRIIFLYLMLLGFNSLILGYSHNVLTEAIIPTVIALSIYVGIRWYNYDFDFEKKKIIKAILYLIFFSLVSIFSYFLKQPYYPVIAGVILILSICSIIKKFKIKNIIYRIMTALFSFIFLLLSLNIWNKFLKENNLYINMGNTYINSSLLNSLSDNYKIIEQTDDNAIVYEIINNKGKVIDYQKLNNNDLGSVLLFYGKQYIKHPIIVLNIMKNGYLTLIDLHKYTSYYNPGEDLVVYDGENKSLGLHPISSGSMMWSSYYLSEHTRDEYKNDYEYAELMKQFETNRIINSDVTTIFNLLFPVYSLLFKFVLLITPILFLIAFIKFLIKKDNLDVILSVIYGCSTIHLLFHTATGAILDRYAYSVYPIALFGLIILYIFEKSKEKI